MQFYWTNKSYPELRDLTPAERRDVSHACWVRPFRHWQTWVAFLSQLIFAWLGLAVGSLIDGWGRIWFGAPATDLVEVHAPVATAILFMLGCIIGTVIFTQVYGHMLRPYLKRYLE